MTSIKETISEWFRDLWEKDSYRFPNLIPVGIGIGICCYFSLETEPDFKINAAIFVFSIFLLGACCVLSKKSSIFRIVRYVFSVFFVISLGFFAAQIRTNFVNTFMLESQVQEPIYFSATIETCEKTEKGLKFIVSNIKRKYDDEKNKLCKKFSKLHLTWIGEKARNSSEDYMPGSRVLFRAILSPIYPQSFPGAYDFKKQQFFKGISARGFVTIPPKILETEDVSSFRMSIEKLRHTINREIEKHLDKKIAAVAEALTTGNTSGITKTIRSNFSNSGIAHVLAISGLHMGIIGLFIFWLVRILLCCIPRISKFYDTKKIAACLSLLLTLFYLFLSGCSISSTRAFIMQTLIVIAVLLDRFALTMRSAAVAATIILISSPEAIMFPSFQLSFGAVIAIVAFYESGVKFPRFLRIFTEAIVTTIVASIPTAIISAFIFNQLTLNSVLANVICIPLMGFFIMPCAMISLFAMIFGISKPFLIITGFGIDFLIKLAEEASKLPGSFFVMHSPTNFVYAVTVLSGLMLALFHHKIRFIGLGGLIFGIFCYFREPLPDIFVSRHAKVVGIRTDDCAAFNHLGYFRSVTDLWAKSIGKEKRERFNSKTMRKYIQKSGSTYSINLKGKKIIVTDDRNYEKDGSEFAVFHLNQEPNEFAQLIYLDSAKTISNERIRRPWS